jgi:SnoaL-like domain
MTNATDTPEITMLSASIETRDADGILAWYAPNAVLTVLDRDHPPTAPAVFTGLDEIGGYFRDVCGRNIDHQVRDVVVTDTGVAFTQHCRYPDGLQVICATVASTRAGKIERQTAVQVWDT